MVGQSERWDSRKVRKSERQNGWNVGMSEWVKSRTGQAVAMVGKSEYCNGWTVGMIGLSERWDSWKVGKLESWNGWKVRKVE
jgi:hypothetical protein